MKKILFSLMGIIISIHAKSINYNELVKEGNKWNYYAIAYTTCCGSQTKTYSLFLSGDTLIENVNYKKMMCEQIDVDYRKILYAGAIRENIEEQSVYFRAENSEEKKVYSFNYNKGDTVFADTISPYVKTIGFVNSVETYNYGNYSGKKVVICDTTYLIRSGEKYCSYYDTWYEGIGSNYLLFQFTNEFYDFPFSLEQTDLLCFWNNNTQIFQNQNYNFCEDARSYSDVKENISNLCIDIYPNPTKDLLYITTELQIKNIKIYGITGNLLFETNEKTIDISELPNGVFIVKIVLPSNEFIEKKITKTTPGTSRSLAGF